MTVRILQGDMREKLAELADASVDSVITDPPYHLTTGKKGGSGPASVNLDSPYGRARVTTGFMGMRWDGGDIALQSATWALLLRVAKPGAHLLAFGGTRTFHRVWCAVEDAGWEIRDTIMWLHGEGFPKSSNQEGDWDGWGTALKPAFEPILLARKPLIGTVPENLKAWGTGALNIMECRVPVDLDVDDPRLGGKGDWSTDKGAKNVYEGGYEGKRIASSEKGRWPANVIHDGSAEVTAAFPQAPGQQADISYSAPSDKTSNVYGRMMREGEPSANSENGGAVGFQMRPGARRMDSGSGARFFWCPKASREDRDDGLYDVDPMRHADRSKADGPGGDNPRNRSNTARTNFHPTVKPTELMQYLIRLVTPRGGLVLDPFMGSGSTGKACMREGMSFIGIEIDPAYIEIARRRIVGVAPLFAEVS